MFYLIIQGHSFEKDIKEMLMQYFPKEVIHFMVNQNKVYSSPGTIITNRLKIVEERYFFYTIIEKNGRMISRQELQLTLPYFQEEKDKDKDKDKWIKRRLKATLYNAMKQGFNHILQWGILTGIRPTKIVHQLMDEGKNDKEIEKKLQTEYLVSDEKIALLREVAKQERKVIYPTDKNRVSVYIGIPFCPSRCVYCSFLSTVLDNKKDILKKYLQALQYEILEIGKYIENNNLTVESIYIGGGTPTVLSAVELDELLYTIDKAIHRKGTAEYTLEAGRPDTIDWDKLIVAQKHGVNRISINPQTMNKDTLLNIGRLHSPEDIINAYKLARKIGFSFVNMDLILGLPGEDDRIVTETLRQIEKLQPENITIHTMAIKKGSRLKENPENISLDKEDKIVKMLEATQEFAKSNEYIPYYLYRQKYMVGNLENVGYCKENYSSIYNIQMIAEKQTIIGIGAGAVTKVIFLDESRIERMPNIKNVDQYIQRVQEMIEKKVVLLDGLYKSQD